MHVAHHLWVVCLCGGVLDIYWPNNNKVARHTAVAASSSAGLLAAASRRCHFPAKEKSIFIIIQLISALLDYAGPLRAVAACVCAMRNASVCQHTSFAYVYMRRAAPCTHMCVSPLFLLLLLFFRFFFVWYKHWHCICFDSPYSLSPIFSFRMEFLWEADEATECTFSYNTNRFGIIT